MPLDGLSLEIFASVSAGTTATVLGHPLDCIKVRLQALQQPGLSTLGCAMQILKADGLQGFFRGIGPPLTEKLLSSTVMFLAFEEAQRRLPDTPGGSLLAGALSGLATSVVSTPTDWVKIQAQVRGVPVQAVLAEVLRHGPLRALHVAFCGGVMNMLREGIFTAVYLGIYARARAAIVEGRGGVGMGATPPLHLVALTSATTGALAWVASFPFDSIKSVQQASPAFAPSKRASIRGAVAALWQQGGLRAFYRGLSASTARAVLVTCSRLFTYEAVKAWCQ